MKSSDEIRAEFDETARRLAEKPRGRRGRRREKRTQYLPARLHESLDIGCGLGDFARELAKRSDRVVALDLSPEMIRVARERSTDYSNIDFVVADVMNWDFPVDRFDLISSFTTLHHMPLRPVLEKIKAGLKPGGMLLVSDLYTSAGWRAGLLALDRVFRHGWKRARRFVSGRKGWTGGVWQHDPQEKRPTLDEVVELYPHVFPGIVVQTPFPFKFYSARRIKPLREAVSQTTGERQPA